MLATPPESGATAMNRNMVEMKDAVFWGLLASWNSGLKKLSRDEVASPATLSHVVL